ncbi:helix-turn-helix domain-containing protein [Acinetobacter sp. JW]|uniref:helix-turn-helix domain-containing protein n=1 Tax=Acinetobacter sp. JW TaxID=2302364 RepID=UPI000E31C81D|nr:helix-turn-helix domain-containing protein [Acinetobacter sp. JW]RFF22773.1 helix-turn-helix domain-containing protein [Acinetobacter sp. JW]
MKNDDFFNRGERLKEERKRLDIKTQDELAEIIGVAKNSISRYEKHNAPLSTDQLDKLEDHGFDISFILWGRRKEQLNVDDLPEDEAKLLNLYRSLGYEAKKGLLLIAETYVQQSR